MIHLQTIPIPDQFFWYAVAGALLLIFLRIATWWIGRVESRQDSTDLKFNVILKELSDTRETQKLQNQVLEQHSKFVEKEGNNLTQMTQKLITTLEFLTGHSEKDEGNPTVRKFREKGKL